MRYWMVFFLAFLSSGCALISLSPTASVPDQTANSSLDPLQAVTPIKESNGAFTLTIISPADQATVSQANVDLRGEVSAPAVLTVNEDTYVLDQGAFTEKVPLQEGLNSIQIVASDMDGNEVDLILTITYQP